jgi:hypothetical protein
MVNVRTVFLVLTFVSSVLILTSTAGCKLVTVSWNDERDLLFFSPSDLWDAPIMANTTNSVSHLLLQYDEDTTTANQATPSLKPVHDVVEDHPTKPYFIFHLGPPKTATTTIQCALDKYSISLARLDSHYFIGAPCRRSGLRMPNKERPIYGGVTSDLSSGKVNGTRILELASRMKLHHSQGHHMIASLEGMSRTLLDTPFVWETLIGLFEDWNVRFVVTYRHYFEWLYSLYYQEHQERRTQRNQWSYRHTSFRAFLSNHINDWEEKRRSHDAKKDAKSLGEHLSIRGFQRFSQHFDTVDFLDLHQEGDVFTNFVCQTIPTAPNTCRLLRNQTTAQRASATWKRVSSNYDGERIAEAAFQQKLWTTTKAPSKEAVARRIGRLLQLEGWDATAQFYTCLPAHLEEKFLYASLSFELEMYALQGTRLSEKELALVKMKHVGMFEKAKAKHKYCEIVPERVLEDEKWRQVVSEIE